MIFRNAKCLIAILLMSGCAAAGKNEAPTRAPMRDCRAGVTVKNRPAESYLVQRITGDEATCSQASFASTPISLAVPVAAPECRHHGAAAAISLVASYYDDATAVCEATEKLAFVPLPTGLPNCCDYACDGWRCDSGNAAMDDGSRDFTEALTAGYGITAEARDCLPGPEELLSEIAAGRPVIVKYGNVFPVRWGVVIGLRPPTANSWRDAGLYTFSLADMMTGQVEELGYSELNRHPKLGRVTAVWIGVIPLDRCR